jgi:hypothetical protein
MIKREKNKQEGTNNNGRKLCQGGKWENLRKRRRKR